MSAGLARVAAASKALAAEEAESKKQKGRKASQEAAAAAAGAAEDSRETGCSQLPGKADGSRQQQAVGKGSILPWLLAAKRQGAQAFQQHASLCLTALTRQWTLLQDSCSKEEQKKNVALLISCSRAPAARCRSHLPPHANLLR
jgi:hypothetical protein